MWILDDQQNRAQQDGATPLIGLLITSLPSSTWKESEWVSYRDYKYYHNLYECSSCFKLHHDQHIRVLSGPPSRVQPVGGASEVSRYRSCCLRARWHEAPPSELLQGSGGWGRPLVVLPQRFFRRISSVNHNGRCPTLYIVNNLPERIILRPVADIGCIFFNQ